MPVRRGDVAKHVDNAASLQRSGLLGGPGSSDPQPYAMTQAIGLLMWLQPVRAAEAEAHVLIKPQSTMERSVVPWTCCPEATGDNGVTIGERSPWSRCSFAILNRWTSNGVAMADRAALGRHKGRLQGSGVGVRPARLSNSSLPVSVSHCCLQPSRAWATLRLSTPFRFAG